MFVVKVHVTRLALDCCCSKLVMDVCLCLLHVFDHYSWNERERRVRERESGVGKKVIPGSSE